MMSRENILNICKMIEDGTIRNKVDYSLAQYGHYFIHSDNVAKVMQLEKILMELSNRFRFDWWHEKDSYFNNRETRSYSFYFNDGINKFEITVFANVDR